MSRGLCSHVIYYDLSALMHSGYLNKYLPDIGENYISSVFNLEITHGSCTYIHTLFIAENYLKLGLKQWFAYHLSTQKKKKRRRSACDVTSSLCDICVLPNKWNEPNHIWVIKQRPVGFLVAQLANARDFPSFQSSQQAQHPHEPWQPIFRGKWDKILQMCKATCIQWNKALITWTFLFAAVPYYPKLKTPHSENSVDTICRVWRIIILIIMWQSGGHIFSQG